MKIALFHPWLKSRGGAERVVLEFLQKTQHDVDVYTWVYDKKNTFEEFEKYNVHVIAGKIAKKISRNFLLRGLFLPLSLFSKIPLENYDLFFISTSGVGELIILRNWKKGKTVAYVHTILRDAYEDIVSWNLKYRYKNLLSKIIYLFFVNIYRIFEKIAWKRIDKVIFNSELSKERAEKHDLLNNKENESISVVYPPVDLAKFNGKQKKQIKEKYFLYVSRFNLPKRQDILIKAWKKFHEINPDYNLILVGNPENKNYFRKIQNMANKVSNVERKTKVDDKKLLELYSNCEGVVFVPFLEDFGIIPFEALAMGKPLIAVDKGGYVD